MKKSFFAALALCAATAFTSCNSVEDIPQAPNQEQQLPEGVTMHKFTAKVPDILRTRADSNFWWADLSLHTRCLQWALYFHNDGSLYKYGYVNSSSSYDSIDLEIPLPDGVQFDIFFWLDMSAEPNQIYKFDPEAKTVSYHDDVISGEDRPETIEHDNWHWMPFHNNGADGEAFAAYVSVDDSDSSTIWLEHPMSQIIIASDEFESKATVSADLAIYEEESGKSLIPTGWKFDTDELIWTEVERSAENPAFTLNKVCEDFGNIVNTSRLGKDIICSMYLFSGKNAGLFSYRNGKPCLLHSYVYANLNNNELSGELIVDMPGYSAGNCCFYIQNTPTTGVFRKNKQFTLEVDESFRNNVSGGLIH